MAKCITLIYGTIFPLTFHDKKIILRFCGVDSAYHIWVNGHEVGYSKGARNEAEFDITPYAKIGETNDLTVRVYQWSDGTYLEDQDMWWLSGIFRDVELLGVPENGLEDFFIISDLDDSYQNGHLAITGKFWQDKGQQVQLELMDQQGKTVLKETVAGNQGTVEFSASLPSVTAWSAEKPYLYQLFITVFSEGEVVEVIPQKVGFRNIHVSGETFLVNGVAIKLKGIVMIIIRKMVEWLVVKKLKKIFV